MIIVPLSRTSTDTGQQAISCSFLIGQFMEYRIIERTIPNTKSGAKRDIEHLAPDSTGLTYKVFFRGAVGCEASVHTKYA